MSRSATLPLALISVLLIWGCATKWEGPDPVKESLPKSRDPHLAQAGMIRLSEVAPEIAIDLRYKTWSAVARAPLYHKDFPALLRPETAVRLKRANALLRPHGYRIKVWDAYRPPTAQVKLWEASGRDDRFVANPFKAPSQHSCGTAVDITLVRLDGSDVEMPTGFDSFTLQAAAGYLHPDSEVLARRRLLQRVMKEAGFYPLPAEWWHFIDRNYRHYPDTIPLSAVSPAF